MRKTKKRLSPSIEALESKQLLSGAGPELAMKALNAAVGDVRAVMGRNHRSTSQTVADSVHIVNNTGMLLKIKATLSPSTPKDFDVPAGARKFLLSFGTNTGNSIKIDRINNTNTMQLLFGNPYKGKWVSIGRLGQSYLFGYPTHCPVSRMR